MRSGYRNKAGYRRGRQFAAVRSCQRGPRREYGRAIPAHITGNGHVTACALGDACYVEGSASFHALDHRRERHEFAALEPNVQEIVRFAAGGICENGARAKRAGPELHTMRVDGAQSTRFQAPRRSVDRHPIKSRVPAHHSKARVCLGSPRCYRSGDKVLPKPAPAAVHVIFD